MKRKAAGTIVASILLFCLTAAPGMAGAKLPRLYSGAGFEVKPSNITDFAMSSATDPQVELVLGGPEGTRHDPGAIEWKKWTADKAVGIGTGWTWGCPKNGGMKAPWLGGKVRITAFRAAKDKIALRQNRFSRVRVFQPDAWRKPGTNSKDYYRMTMVYTGVNRPGSGWYPISVHYPSDLEPTGHAPAK